MNVEKEIELIKSYRDSIKGYQLAVKETEQKVADFLCPFKVGDRVLNGNGEVEIIDVVYFSEWSKDYGFAVKRIRKDGQPYVYRSSVYDVSKYTKAPEQG